MVTKRIHKQIEFTGDYSQLKKMGYGFQKLYAGNYMQWAKETTKHLCNTRVWKKGAEVTIDTLTNYEGFFFAELLKWKAAGKSIPLTRLGTIKFVRNTETREIFFDQEKIDEAVAYERQINDAFHAGDEEKATALYDAKVLDIQTISPRDLEPLAELNKLGWVKVRQFVTFEV